MPVGYAIAQSDLAHLDRFTARCRVPLDMIANKPQWASLYGLYRPSQDSTDAFICRVALAPNDGRQWVYDDTIRINIATRPSLYKKIVAANARASTYPGFYWIPRELIRDAGGVTMGIDTDSIEGGFTAARKLIAEQSYRQLLHESMQHRLAVCKLASVRLPLPESLRKNGSRATISCRVVSTYPAEDIVCITMNTRVTITVPNPVEVTEHISIHEDISHAAEEEAPILGRVGGLEKELLALQEMIMLPIKNRELQAEYRIEFPKGALLSGPPGVGKTLLVRTAVEACRVDIPLHLEIINGSEIMSSSVGEAEQTLREIFRRASAQAAESQGASVIFIDELDALCPKREANGAMAHSRIVAQLLTLLDGADKSARENVLIIGATNLPNNIDAALRRPGRFDREIPVAPPGIEARKHIFQVHMADLPYVVDGTLQEKEAFVDSLAAKAIGYVGADIAALCREALSIATTRQFVELTKNQQLQSWWQDWKRHGKTLHISDVEKMVAGIAWKVSPVAIPVWFLSKPPTLATNKPASKPVEFFRYLFQGLSQPASQVQEPSVAVPPPTSTPEPTVFQVTMADFEQAMQVVVASALRSTAGLAKGGDQLTWDSIGGQEDTKLALQQALEWPIKYPQTFTRLGITPPRGILLYGPPGCSKSTIVRAAAHSSGATFLSLSAAQVFSPFFGDAEASVRQVFRDARAALPAIIFFDEIDVLVTKREFDSASTGSGSGSGSTALRVLSTMLNEMDGVESAEGLLVIGATNRPERIDAALLRPGRFDRILFVDLPTERDRFDILQIHTRKMTLDMDVDLETIAIDTDCFSGAELENVCREAALHALRESIEARVVCMHHFESAVATITPVSTPASLETYFEFAATMA